MAEAKMSVDSVIDCSTVESVLALCENIVSSKRSANALRNSIKVRNMTFDQGMLVSNSYLRRISGDKSKVDKFLTRETLSDSETVARHLQVIQHLCPALSDMVDSLFDEFSYDI